MGEKIKYKQTNGLPFAEKYSNEWSSSPRARSSPNGPFNQRKGCPTVSCLCIWQTYWGCFFLLPPPVLDQRQWDWNIFKADRAHLPHPFASVDLLCRSTVQVLENCSIELWGFELCQKYYYYTSAATPPPVTGSSHTWGKRGRARNYWTEHFCWMEFFTNANRAMLTFGHVGAFLIDLPCCSLSKIRINV